ncbi:MAG: DUF4852 domain-containing protein [Alphaproteobacteria bacterium]|nr:DUF4852 domain-containing protein [Alphaproteobacteria bacterium]
MMTRFIQLFLFFALLMLVPVGIVLAQEKVEEGDFIAGPTIEFETGEVSHGLGPIPEKKEEAVSGNSEVTIIEDKYAGMYVEPTLQNISKLYWKKEALTLDTDKAIDNFMLINECDIYEKFYRDDFEWMRIREAGRKMLEETKDSFPYKFKMLIPIDLGRYDLLRGGFPLINKTAFKDLRRVEIGGNSNNKPMCGKEGIIKHYPRNLILILNKPFSYDFVDLDEHIAQAFIIRRKYEKIKRPKELMTKRYDRLAFARVRITFSDYQGETRGSDNFPLGIMFGKLDGIDIFEDAGEKRMLTSLDYK